jgi:hypothetical protein
MICNCREAGPEFLQGTQNDLFPAPRTTTVNWWLRPSTWPSAGQAFARYVGVSEKALQLSDEFIALLRVLAQQILKL